MAKRYSYSILKCNKCKKELSYWVSFKIRIYSPYDIIINLENEALFFCSKECLKKQINSN